MIIQETLRVRTQYTLSPNDSIHFGTLLTGKQKDIVMFDRKFKDAVFEEGINVWYSV